MITTDHTCNEGNGPVRGMRTAGCPGCDERLRITFLAKDLDVARHSLDPRDAARINGLPVCLPADLRAGLKSKVADLANIGDRFGGMLTAGIFLQEFVGSTPWAHLDVAGPAYNERTAFGYTPVGGTGVGVRTLLRLLEQRAA